MSGVQAQKNAAALKDEAVAIGRRAKQAAGRLAQVSATEKNRDLLKMAGGLLEQQERLLEANRRDLEAARQSGVAPALLDRIALNAGRIQAMAKGIQEVVALPDPVREVVRMWRRPNGLQVGRMRIPLGVITIIYEARPNVTADAAVLCLKSGNAVILRGGSEAFFSNQAIGEVLQEACNGSQIPQESIQVVKSRDRALVRELLQLDGLIDLVIPRGGEELIASVTATSRVPVIKHFKGVCHVYIDSEAALDMAERIAMNAKVQRPSVCNAMETLLVHEAIAPGFLPGMIVKLQQAGVEIRGCEKTRALVPRVQAAAEE